MSQRRLTRQQVAGDADPLLDYAGRQMEDELRAENAARSAHSHRRKGSLTAVGMRARGSQWEKLPHRGTVQDQPHYGAPGWILRCQESAGQFQALVTVVVDPSSSSGSRERLVRRTRNANVT
jgi:hypothetical protein